MVLLNRDKIEGITLGRLRT